MSDRVVVGGASLSLEDVERVAAGAGVTLAPEARGRMEASRAVVERALAEGRVVYGVTTGFGRLSRELIQEGERRALQVNLLRSTAAGVGEPLSEPVTRAVMLLRAHTLTRGRSGVRPVLVERLLQLLEAGIYPRIPSQGSVGASGDLAPLAHMGLVLIGEGEAWDGTAWAPAAAILAVHGIEPVELEAKEGLSLVNGTQVMTAIGALALLGAERLAATADLAGAMSLEAMRGTRTAFREEIHAARGHRGQEESAARIRALLGARSEIGDSHAECGRVQDAYSLRCMPQVHGAAREALRYVRGILATEVDAATDNPLVFAGDGGEGEILSGGNFHGAPVAAALDVLAIALTDLASISERRTAALVDPDASGLPAFLTRRAGLESGFMIPQVTAAALVSESKGLAHPASVDSIPTSANIEDHVSMGVWAALKAARVLANAERVLAIELLAAAQGVDLLRPLRTSAPLESAHAALRQRVPPLDEDRPFGADIEAVAEMVREGRFAKI